MYFKRFKVYRDELINGKIHHTNEYDVMTGKNLFKLLKGMAQGKMKWYYTMEEVMERIDKM